jgi:hypothetical protein
MKVRIASLFPMLVFGVAAEAQAAPSFVERASPAGETPRYIRIDVEGYNIRRSPEFSYLKSDNVDFRSARGAIFAVRRKVNMENGVAVNILANGQDRWVYVPNWRRHDFQFCDSEACFSDLSDALRAVGGQGARASSGASGCAGGCVPGQHNLPRQIDDIPLPPPRPLNLARQNENRLSPQARAVSSGPVTTVTPLWENARRDVGRRWTNMLVESLQRHGQGLLRSRTLSDQRNWCPNYSRLSDRERQEFWVHLFNGIARYESNFATGVTFDEATFRNVRRGRINPRTFSQGLFQLSYESSSQRAYRNFCHFDWRRDRYKDVSDSSLTIYDPKKQMDCAVGIMNHLVGQNGGLGFSSGRTRSGLPAWKGGARFWSTLRHTNPATARVRESLRRYSPCWR